jgi:hypothetical protein
MDLKASIVGRVLRNLIGVALDGDDGTFSMLDAELAHCAHENPASRSIEPFRFGASELATEFPTGMSIYNYINTESRYNLHDSAHQMRTMP